MANESLSKLRKLQVEAQAVLEGKEEDLQPEGWLSGSHSIVRFAVRAHRSFVQHRGPVRAAALAYTTVLALVPLLAIAVSVSTTLLKKEGEEPVKKLIDGFVRYVAPALDLTTNAAPALNLKAIPDSATSGITGENAINRQRVVDEINGFVQRFRSGTLGASGVLALVFVAISLLSTIEATFNDMWGVREGRSWPRRVALYWTGLTLGPLLLVAAIGITGASQFQTAESLIARVEIVRKALYLFVVPCLVLGLSLSLLYVLMPNAKVDWRAALVGGFVAALLLQANSALSVIYLSRVVTYRDIYGTLAAVPLFLLGLYVSWVIVLWGGQVAYVFQTRKTHVEDKQADRASQQSREIAALRVMTCVGQRFKQGGPPHTSASMAAELRLPERLIHQILTILVRNKLLVEIAGPAAGYSPSRPLENITAQVILHALRVGHGQELALCDDAPGRVVREQFDSIQQAEKQQADTVTLRDLVDKTASASPSR